MTVHKLVTGFLLLNLEVDDVQHVSHGIDRLSPEPSRCSMPVEHHPSRFAEGHVFPFHHAILGRHIRTRKLVFKTQVMAKGFEARGFES
jgi:hypothetical protein